MVFGSFALVGAFALLSNATPLTTNGTKDACAQIASAYTAQKSAAPAAAVKVPGQLAYDCLNSVPLHQKEASALMDAILPYVEWQSGELNLPGKGLKLF